ncbi:MAG: hypothetical protein IJ265_08440 [Oscillospiraceae bacterium]|nr:hypothetical protein [Oscillospiraceae bacterium]
MTRKEIEKRCLEEMQQTIPDHEALWQKIEAQLPPQDSQNQKASPIRMQSFRRFMTIAACLLVTVTGAYVLTRQSGMENAVKHEQSDTANEHMDAPEQEGEHFAPNQPEDFTPIETLPPENSGIRTYASLGLPVSDTAVHVPDPDKLTAGTQLFHEESVLAKTECFVDVIVYSGNQSPETGQMVYLLEVVDVYGTDAFAAGETFWMHSSSPYVLQKDHEYVLPLYQNEFHWELVNESAPQIELTADGEAVYHNGWKSLESEASEPLLYEQNGTDDYFYDRMYITQNAVLCDFLAEWEASRM